MWANFLLICLPASQVDDNDEANNRKFYYLFPLVDSQSPFSAPFKSTVSLKYQLWRATGFISGIWYRFVTKENDWKLKIELQLFCKLH